MHNSVENPAPRYDIKTLTRLKNRLRTSAQTARDFEQLDEAQDLDHVADFLEDTIATLTNLEQRRQERRRKDYRKKRRQRRKK